MNNTFVSLIATAAAFLLNLILTPVLILISHRKGWYDSIDHRKIHSGSIPRLGGIGIFLSFIIVIVLLFLIDQFLIPMPLINLFILLGVLLASNLIGLIDDFTNLRPRYKLIIQIAISLFLVIFGFRFSSISIPFMKNSVSIPLFLSYPLTILWILGLTNAINLIDGVDGLAGGVTLISLIGFSLIFFVLNVPSGVIVSLVMLGAIGGFLVFNLPRAKIFMGDSGSILLGTVVGVIPLIFPHPKMLIGALTILLIPVTDTIYAICRRTLKKQPFYIPDKDHIHHMLLHLGFKTGTILLVLYLYAAVLTAAAIYWFVAGNLLSEILILLVWIFNITALCKLAAVHRKKIHKPTC